MNQTSEPLHPIRIALAGAGIFARDAHLPSLLRLRNDFEIVAIYSRTEASAARMAKELPGSAAIYTDYAALLADPTVEALDVVLPIPAVPGALLGALAGSKHILSEKPIAPDRATARTLLAAYSQRDHQVWMVGENWRYESAIVQAAELVRGGAIGAPVTCHAALYSPVAPGNKYYGSTWRESGEIPGGHLLDGGVHHIAALRMIVGEISAVSATAKQLAAHLPPVDTISAHLLFANGAMGTYLASFAVGAPWPPYFHIVGEKGALRVQRGEIELTSNGATQVISCPKYDGVEMELRAFAQAIRQQTPHINTPEEAERDLAVIEALLQSASSAQMVAIP
jgi:predicted dehydrogenase